MKTQAMKNPLTLYFTALAFLFLIAVGAAYAMKSYGALGAQSAAAGNPAVHQVALKDGAAFPNEVIIELGDQVQFNSSDGRTHNISSGKGNDYGEEHGHVASGADSGEFGADEGYLVSFSEPGTYYFHDHYDADAFITVLVYTPEEGA